MQYRSNTNMRYAYLLFGTEAVNDAGIAVLGYPGLWTTHKFEGDKIREYLEIESDQPSQ